MIPFSEQTLLLSKITKLSKEDIIAGDYALNENQQLIYDELCKKREEGYPIAYLMGEKEFLGRTFKLDENVLIPRPESECLVEKVLEKIGNKRDCSILDLGCGSGCLGISLGVELGGFSKLTLADISPEALYVASVNAENLLGSDFNIEFMESDLFGNIPDSEKFDVVVANLPYVESDFVDSLEKDNEILFEPRIALESGVDGLDHYKVFLNDIWAYLGANFVVGLECDPSQIENLKKILKDCGQDFDLEVFCDLAGNLRGLVVSSLGK